MIFGLPNERARLELVDGPHGIAPRPTVEDAIVLYYEPETARRIGDRLSSAAADEVPPNSADLNPYWPRQKAATFRVGPTGTAYGVDFLPEMLQTLEPMRSRRASPTSSSCRA